MGHIVCATFSQGVDARVKTLYSAPHSRARPLGLLDFSYEAQIVKSADTIRTRRPEQGLGAFARVASGLASMGHGKHTSTERSFGPAGLCWLDRAENQVHPGEGSA